MRIPIAIAVALIATSPIAWAKKDRFQGDIRAIPASVEAKMVGVSWHKGCPVSLADLRYLRMSHWDFNGNVSTGYMIVHHDAADEVVWAFEQMFEHRFPIERMKLIHNYRGSDKKSTTDNNTSSFNCRFVTGKKGVFSKHSYGRAIDVNPQINPYVKRGAFEPKNAKRFLNRRRNFKGSINRNGLVVRIFSRLGWKWGGNWRSLKDYQHFEKPIVNK